MRSRYKRFGLLTLMVLLFSVQINIVQAHVGKPTVYVNGQKLDVDAIATGENNSVTFIPFRPIFEALEMEVEWDEKTKTVTASKDSTLIKLRANNLTGFLNEKKVQLSSAPFINNDTLYVNLRFIAEGAGGKVRWEKVSDNEMYVYIELTDSITNSNN
ncbi:copper amine oxidase N-terminal domain-containing protein [Paenibacillus sp. SC116]|uniref:copper amine oxidase N-terminal domain-containing protein n=1 Tax=Paenibacillus sp. SC116 TaxID=2968986 RepID=UPI00215A2744|nr:copper amine oxidase N-terminal domain-containing protein [Paenibacillus sp. SC116]MCR8845054.1 copper amine oxidase N-terminal domain-containing protein [Paenibacillus sp. SC116]